MRGQVTEESSTKAAPPDDGHPDNGIGRVDSETGLYYRLGGEERERFWT